MNIELHEEAVAKAIDVGSDTNFRGVDAGLLESDEFLRRVLESSGDCIKVLDLDACLVFMSAGGMRVMEIDDFGPLAGCPWLDFWKGEKADDAHAAVALAKAGGLGRFQGWCATGKGALKWWDVQVTPINGPDGRPQQLLSISRDITEFKRAEERQILLAEEMHHRVKNLLTVVQTVASQTLRDGAGSLRAARQSLAARFTALGKAHDALAREPGDAIVMAEVVTGVLAPYGQERFRIDGPSLTLTGRQAHAFTLAFHELATNAVKYGALSGSDGRVGVQWRIEKNVSEAKPLRLALAWTEQGGPSVSPPARKGFGSRLIEHSIADLGGRVQIVYNPKGLLCTIEVPLASEG